MSPSILEATRPPGAPEVQLKPISQILLVGGFGGQPFTKEMGMGWAQLGSMPGELQVEKGMWQPSVQHLPAAGMSQLTNEKIPNCRSSLLQRDSLLSLPKPSPAHCFVSLAPSVTISCNCNKFGRPQHDLSWPFVCVLGNNVVAARRCQFYKARGCCTAGRGIVPSQNQQLGFGPFLSSLKVKTFSPFYLKTCSEKNNPCGNFSLTHEEGTFHQQDNAHGGEKTCHFLLG